MARALVVSVLFHGVLLMPPWLAPLQPMASTAVNVSFRQNAIQSDDAPTSEDREVKTSRRAPSGVRGQEKEDEKASAQVQPADEYRGSRDDKTQTHGEAIGKTSELDSVVSEHVLTAEELRGYRLALALAVRQRKANFDRLPPQTARLVLSLRRINGVFFVSVQEPSGSEDWDRALLNSLRSAASSVSLPRPLGSGDFVVAIPFELH
jgi:hypothetical protein